jgi:hypothetical protein
MDAVETLKPYWNRPMKNVIEVIEKPTPRSTTYLDDIMLSAELEKQIPGRATRRTSR